MLRGYHIELASMEGDIGSGIFFSKYLFGGEHTCTLFPVVLVLMGRSSRVGSVVLRNMYALHPFLSLLLRCAAPCSSTELGSGHPLRGLWVCLLEIPWGAPSYSHLFSNLTLSENLT